MMRHVKTCSALLLTMLTLAAPAAAQTARAASSGKPGGVLKPVLREDLPQGFAIHESATNSVTWPAMPCYSNLVIFDQQKQLERTDTIVPELAERWSWQDNYRNLVFFLRKDVKWHDGQPFTSKDVKFTFDVVREAKDAAAKLRINPRKEWYGNVEAIETPDASTVVFRLKRPQPSLLTMLASGYSPVLPAHVPLAEHRSKCIGTGPFKFKEWKRGEGVELVKNPDYFIKGRPYLDGIHYIIIVERGTRVAALQAGQVDVAYPGDTTVDIAERLKGAVPKMVFTETSTNVSENLLFNTTKAPLDNVKVRRALSLAIDRKAYVQAVHRGSAIVGAAMSPKPWGVWGLLDKDLAQLAGYGKGAEDKARAKKLLAEAGFGPSNPLKMEMVTRAIAIYIDFAAFVVSEFKNIGVEATLKQIDTAQWHPMATRREFLIGANLTGLGIDDPDANFYENYACGSPRNYGGYCNELVMGLIDKQSQETDPQKRAAIVWDIQKKLEEDSARPIMGWRIDRFAHLPTVKNLVPHSVVYNCCRLQDTWLDK
jgi:peptide/nickel transport system substrate-binding protein